MFSVKNGEIYHTRGDTGSLSFTLKDENEKEITGYSAVLSVKKKLRDKQYLFQVLIENGVCNITHEMTQNLPFGDYCYDIQTTLPDGRVWTYGPYTYHLLADVTTI